jgi:hypothetical protein
VKQHDRNKITPHLLVELLHLQLRDAVLWLLLQPLLHVLLLTLSRLQLQGQRQNVDATYKKVDLRVVGLLFQPTTHMQSLCC